MSEAPTLSPLEWEGDRAPFAKAFVAAQRATEAVKKANTNPAFKSKYADLAGVVEAVVPALNANGIGVLQYPAFDGDLVSVTTELLHESGASVRSTLKMRPTKNDPQGEGSAITYARRYSLLAMTGAAPEDDDGQAASRPSQNNDRPEPKRAETKPPTLTERAERFVATLTGVKTEDELRKAYALGSKLCAELDTTDPERLVEINTLYERRFGEFAELAA
jgi:hypothetical protein